MRLNVAGEEVESAAERKQKGGGGWRHEEG